MLAMLQGFAMTRPTASFAPAGKMGRAVQLILGPMILRLVDRKRRTA